MVEGSRIVLKPGATEISGFCHVFAVVTSPRAYAMSADNTRMSGLFSNASRMAVSSVSTFVPGVALVSWAFAGNAIALPSATAKRSGKLQKFHCFIINQTDKPKWEKQNSTA